MGDVDQRQSTNSLRTGKTGSKEHINSDARTVVLGRKRKSGCLSSHQITNNSISEQLKINNILNVLTYPNFQPSPASFKPAWNSLFKDCRNRVDTIQKLLRQCSNSFLSILRQNNVKWISRAAISTPQSGCTNHYQTIKLFIRPTKPIMCEFQVRGYGTKGLLEGIEVMTGQSMMRVHLSYPSPQRRTKLHKLFCLLVRAFPNLNHYTLQNMWETMFQHKRVAQGYEYANRLIRFGPGSKKKTGRRPVPWKYYGYYVKLDSMTDKELQEVQFMTTYSRKDRSINKIRIVGEDSILI